MKLSCGIQCFVRLLRARALSHVRVYGHITHSSSFIPYQVHLAPIQRRVPPPPSCAAARPHLCPPLTGFCRRPLRHTASRPTQCGRRRCCRRLCGVSVVGSWLGYSLGVGLCAYCRLGAGVSDMSVPDPVMSLGAVAAFGVSCVVVVVFMCGRSLRVPFGFCC